MIALWLPFDECTWRKRARSRAGASRDDSPSRHPGVLLARILFFGVKNTSSCKLLEQKPRNFLSLLKCSSRWTADRWRTTLSSSAISGSLLLSAQRFFERDPDQLHIGMTVFSCFSSFLFRHSGNLVIRTHHEYGRIDSMVCPNETTSGPIWFQAKRSSRVTR